ncbi:MAG: dipeptidase [Roseiflexus castenholzii]|uniref:dipeptidase n=1 Tax=Roseiflexus castenholzii TaxID=120962 RepID=UPI000CB2BDB6|nr:MAG: dipeptidase [Roseiflexus castenholzii]
MTWQTYLREQQDRFLAELLDFLHIPSVSALPEHAGDVQRAAEWVAERMRTAGIESVQILPTGGHPVVYGDWLHAPGKPTVLIYGHFDTQPADPLELWEHPPFEPLVRDGRVYARGASDDKGNMLPPILAVEALLRTTGALPVNVRFLFEGQEEIGSPQIPAFVKAYREMLACDLVVSSDGGQWSETEPVILTGLRGGCGVQIDVRGPNRDLHSGIYGGAVQNPIHALASILASMRGADGRILVEGFYDAVQLLTDDERRRFASVPFDEAAYMADLGVTALWGEAGYTVYERTWARPTLEINGVWGGFQGEGVKTVLPAEAHAKITCRLVANQDPATIVELIKSHVQQHTPPGVTVTVTPLKFLAKPYLMPFDHSGNRAARDVLVHMYGREPYEVRSGGSIPICTILLDELGVYTVNFAFALEDERQHSPNEFFRLSSFRRGQEGYCLLLERLADVG